MRDDRPIRELQSRQLVRAGLLLQLPPRPFAQERERAAVTGDLLLVWDTGLLKSFLDAATRMNSRPAFVAVANVESIFSAIVSSLEFSS